MATQFESRVTQKMCEMQKQAVIELISLTGFNVHAFNLKGVEGARYAIEAIKEKGYVITRIETDNVLEMSYILQRYGERIARRDVSIRIKIDKKVVEKGVKKNE